MTKKRDIKIRDFILIQIISFIIVAILNFRSIDTLMSLPIYDDKNKIFIICVELLALILLLLNQKISKEDIKNLYTDFKLKLNIKELIGRYVNSISISIGVTLLVSSILILFANPSTDNLIQKQSINMAYTGNIIIIIVSVAIMGPILEEIVFRKILFTCISRKIGVKKGIIISSLLFGLGHNINNFLFATLFGIILCILYVKYKNILIPIFLHSMNNTISILFQFVKPASIVNDTINISLNTVYISLIAGLLLTIAGVYYYVRYIYNNRNYIK